jgi:quinoprotein glucose dehydrogenase
MWGRMFKAYDKLTGELLWEMELPSATTGGPMSYMHGDKQYIVVALGSLGGAAEWVALGLP